MVVTAFFEEKDSQNLRMEGCLVKHEKKNKPACWKKKISLI